MSSSLESTSTERPFVSKEWGFEEWLVNNDQYCAKLLHLQHGFQSSLHYHAIKHESFFCLAGAVHVEYYDVQGRVMHETILCADTRDGLTVPPGTPHRFYSMGGDAMLLEVSTHHDDTDVIRLEPSGERIIR